MEWGPKRVNAELQAYVKLPANIFIKNNNLVLRAVKSGIAVYFFSVYYFYVR